MQTEILIMLTWTLIKGYQITDITNAPGMVPLKGQNSYLIKDYFTTIHFVNYSNIINELQTTRYQIESFPNVSTKTNL